MCTYIEFLMPSKAIVTTELTDYLQTRNNKRADSRAVCSW